MAHFQLLGRESLPFGSISMEQQLKKRKKYLENKMKKISISTRIKIFVGMLVIIPIVFLGWFFISHETGVIEDNLSFRATSLVNRLSNDHEIELAILVDDYDELKRQMGIILKEKDVAYGIVLDTNGKKLAYVGKPGEEEIREFKCPIITRPQLLEDIPLDTLNEHDASRQGEKIGTVILGISLAKMKQKTAHLKKIFGVVLGIVLLISIAGGLFGVRHLINQPLRNLITSIEAIGIGDLSHRVEMNSNDELGKLADSFNLMIENLSRLLISKNYVNNILDSMNDMLLVFDLDGTIKTVNHTTLHLLGFEEMELIGKSFKLVLEEEQLFADPSKLTSFKKTDILYNNKERYLIKKDGTRLPVSFSATFMYNNGGNLQGIICVAQDISEKKRGEEEKQQLENRLLMAEKMEALGRLAGGVAHDLNNTLGAIVGYPDLLMRKLPPDSPHQKGLLTIKQSGQKAADIVQDLLTLARRGIATDQTVSINHLVNEYLNSAEFEKLMSLHPGIAIKVDLEPVLLNIKGSPLHLAKAIMNLVSNAAEAINQDGEIVIQSINQFVEKNITGGELDLTVGEYVVLSIRDTGLGISEGNLKKIFEPFFTTKEMGRSGTGLGMAVVWGTVKDHQGYIDVKSTPGKGTTFKLFFPATGQELEEGIESLSIEEYMGDGQHILVVDDLPEQREISSNLLRMLGYYVKTVDSGEEAIKYMKQQPVDLLVLDMIMSPGMDGLETFTKVKELFPGTKAIIASGYSETSRVRKAQKIGAGAYLQKPFTLETIGMAVKNELNRQ
jgi:two-component system, cell cycle sensor histidine kinase and response regulator CckA